MVNKKRKVDKSGVSKKRGYDHMTTGGTKKKPSSKSEAKSMQKYLDTDFSSAAVASTGTILAPSLNLLAAGTGPSQIIGREMRIMSISIRFDMQIDAVASGGTNNRCFWRILLIMDRQANGSAATVTEIFGTSPTVRSHINLAEGRRFHIMKEWLINMSPHIEAGTGAQGAGAFHYEKWFKDVKIPIYYSTSPSGVIGNVKDRNLLLVAFEVGDTPHSINGRARIRYIDA